VEDLVIIVLIAPRHENSFEVIRQGPARAFVLSATAISPLEFPPLLVALVFTPSWNWRSAGRRAHPRRFCAV